MFPKGRSARWLGLTLLVMAVLGAAGVYRLPWMIDRVLRSAMKRTPYKLAYAGQTLTWPPGAVLRDVMVTERSSGRLVATLPRLALSLGLGSEPTGPRWLTRLTAPSVTLKRPGALPWPQDHARRLLKNALKNFRKVGLRWEVERLALESRDGWRATIGSVTGAARASGPDTIRIVMGGTIINTHGLAAEVQGPFTWSITIQRYMDSTLLEHVWDGKGLRVAKEGRVVKKAGSTWQVRSTIPWLATLSLGENPPQTVMNPKDPRLQALWGRLWP